MEDFIEGWLEDSKIRMYIAYFPNIILGSIGFILLALSFTKDTYSSMWWTAMIGISFFFASMKSKYKIWWRYLYKKITTSVFQIIDLW